MYSCVDAAALDLFWGPIGKSALGVTAPASTTVGMVAEGRNGRQTGCQLLSVDLCIAVNELFGTQLSAYRRKC